MKPRNSNSAGYSPSQVPTKPEDLPRFIREELDKIAATMNLIAAGRIDPSYVAPDKPRNGDLRYAAGAPNWNPGGGKGIYMYSTVWTLIKAIP